MGLVSPKKPKDLARRARRMIRIDTSVVFEAIAATTPLGMVSFERRPLVHRIAPVVGLTMLA